MPFRSKKKQKAYVDRWRQQHPTYMRDYYQNKVKPLGRRKPAAAPCLTSS